MLAYTYGDTGIVFFDRKDISNLFLKMKELKLIPLRYQNGWQFDDSKLNDQVKAELNQVLYQNHSNRITQDDIELFEDYGDILDSIISILNNLIQMKHSTSFDTLLPTQKDVDQEINQQIPDCCLTCICNVDSSSDDYTSDILSYSNIRRLLPAMDPNTVAFVSRDCFIKEKYWTDNDAIIPAYAPILDCKDDFDGKMFIESNVFNEDELKHIYRVNLTGFYDGITDCVPDEVFVDDDACHDLCYSVRREGMPINDYLALLKKVDSFLRSRSEYVSLNYDDGNGMSEICKPDQIPSNENMFVGFDKDGSFNIYG